MHHAFARLGVSMFVFHVSGLPARLSGGRIRSHPEALRRGARQAESKASPFSVLSFWERRAGTPPHRCVIQLSPQPRTRNELRLLASLPLLRLLEPMLARAGFCLTRVESSLDFKQTRRRPRRRLGRRVRCRTTPLRSCSSRSDRSRSRVPPNAVRPVRPTSGRGRPSGGRG